LLEVPQRNGALRGKRARHDLRERQRKAVRVLGNPAAALDQVAVHEANQRHRSAEADRPQLQEVADQRDKRLARRPCWLGMMRASVENRRRTGITLISCG
jgi:hypothetical protein